MAHIPNIKKEIHAKVTQDSVATELAIALDGLFTIEYYRKSINNNATYSIMYCKPTNNIAESLLLDREVLSIILNKNDIQVRTILYAIEIISSSNGRLDPGTIIIVHSDRNGDEKLRSWGREHGLKIFPVYRKTATALPSSNTFRRLLAQDLFSQDQFILSGPVLSDGDFFGRRNDAIEMLRQLQSGRIRSLFGIRKVGKTSLINRIVNLARESGTLRVAMIDCSVDSFNKLSYTEALKAIAKVARIAAHRKYAHITDALKKGDEELVPTFEDLWGKEENIPLALIFDEVDYITPVSPLHPHWKSEFNSFWRELRVIYQEAQRMKFPLSILVSGVSSAPFRLESIDGIENSVLHFVPEEYLAPFSTGGSVSMMKDLFLRCGLNANSSTLAEMSKVCGNFPYWMRMAGSYIHRSIDIQSRPIQIDSNILARLMDEFIEAEGAEVARVALEDLRRKTPDPIILLGEVINKGGVPLGRGHLLVRYGLASNEEGNIQVTSKMILAGYQILRDFDVANPEKEKQIVTQIPNLHLNTEEWAEELAIISRRRILVERKLREYVHIALKFTSTKDESWTQKLVQSLDARRKSELSVLSGELLLAKLYWSEIKAIIIKNWTSFERVIGDQKRFISAMDLLNDRPDAHSKAGDAADIAMYRRELKWIEERLS